MIILFLLYVTLTVSGLTLFKLGSAQVTCDPLWLGVQLQWTSLIGIVCYLASFLLWLMLVNKSELSYIFPLSAGLVNIAVLCAAYFILKEKITSLQLLGAAVVILGIILMNVRK